MADPFGRVAPASNAPRGGNRLRTPSGGNYPRNRTGLRFVLSLTFLCIFVAVCVSAGLVVYTAWYHDLKNGLFALAFAVLSGRATLSWCLWWGAEGDPQNPR